MTQQLDTHLERENSARRAANRSTRVQPVRRLSRFLGGDSGPRKSSETLRRATGNSSLTPERSPPTPGFRNGSIHKLSRPRASRAPLRKRSSARGFTLVEIGSVLALLVLLVGVAVPTMNSMTGVTARSSVGKLASNIRATRGSAALSGQTCRITFELEESSYFVECADGVVRHAPAERSLSRGRRNDERTRRLLEEDESRLTESERLQRQLLMRNRFASSPRIPQQTLDGGLEFVSVWTSHQAEKYTNGTAHLYFYPSGLGEHANIHLRRGEEDFTIHVFPLAGRVRVLPGKVELKGIERMR